MYGNTRRYRDRPQQMRQRGLLSSIILARNAVSCWIEPNRSIERCGVALNSFGCGGLQVGQRGGRLSERQLAVRFPVFLSVQGYRPALSIRGSSVRSQRDVLVAAADWRFNGSASVRNGLHPRTARTCPTMCIDEYAPSSSQTLNLRLLAARENTAGHLQRSN